MFINRKKWIYRFFELLKMMISIALICASAHAQEASTRTETFVITDTRSTGSWEGANYRFYQQQDVQGEVTACVYGPMMSFHRLYKEGVGYQPIFRYNDDGYGTVEICFYPPDDRIKEEQGTKLVGRICEVPINQLAMSNVEIQLLFQCRDVVGEEKSIILYRDYIQGSYSPSTNIQSITFKLPEDMKYVDDNLMINGNFVLSGKYSYPVNRMKLTDYFQFKMTTLLSSDMKKNLTPPTDGKYTRVAILAEQKGQFHRKLSRRIEIASKHLPDRKRKEIIGDINAIIHDFVKPEIESSLGGMLDKQIAIYYAGIEEKGDEYHPDVSIKRLESRIVDNYIEQLYTFMSKLDKEHNLREMNEETLLEHLKKEFSWSQAFSAIIPEIGPVTSSHAGDYKKGEMSDSTRKSLKFLKDCYFESKNELNYFKQHYRLHETGDILEKKIRSKLFNFVVYDLSNIASELNINWLEEDYTTNYEILSFSDKWGPITTTETIHPHVGMVTVWYRPLKEIPYGWEIADGEKPHTLGATLKGNKPNLMGKIPRMPKQNKDFNKFGEIGKDIVTLKKSQLPKHKHYYYDSWWAENPDSGRNPDKWLDVWNGHGNKAEPDGDNKAMAMRRKTDPTGEGKPISILPACLDVYYIVKVK